MSSADASLKLIAKGSMITFVGIITSKILTFFYRMVIARYMGPEQYGLLALGLAAAGFLALIADLGFSSGILRYVSFYRGKEDLARVKGVITSSLKVTLPTSIFFGLLLFVFSDFLALEVFHNENLTPIFKILSFGVPFTVVLQNLSFTFMAFQKPEYEASVNRILSGVFLVLLTFVFLAFGTGILGAASAFMLSKVLACILALYLLEKKVFPIIKTSIKSVGLLRELFSYSWPLTLLMFLTMIVNYTDVFMLGYFRTTSEVGIYDIAISLTALMTIVEAMFSGMAMATITGLYSKGQMIEFKSVYKSVARWVFLLNLPIFLILVVFSKQIIIQLFGEAYIDGWIVLTILGFARFLTSLSFLSSQVIIILKRTKLMLLNTIIVAAANIILNYILIPPLGILGAAIGTGFSFTLGATILVAEAYYFMKVQPISIKFIKPATAGALSVVIVYAIVKNVEIGSIFLLIPLLLFFILLYSLFLLLLKSFEEEDLEILKAIERKSGADFTKLNNLLRRFVR